MRALILIVIALLAVSALAEPRQPISNDGRPSFEAATVKPVPQGRALLGGMVSDATGLKGRYTMDLDDQFPPRVPQIRERRQISRGQL